MMEHFSTENASTAMTLFAAAAAVIGHSRRPNKLALLANVACAGGFAGASWLMRQGNPDLAHKTAVGSSVAFTALHAALHAGAKSPHHMHFGMFGALSAFMFVRELATASEKEALRQRAAGSGFDASRLAGRASGLLDGEAEKPGQADGQ